MAKRLPKREEIVVSPYFNFPDEVREYRHSDERVGQDDDFDVLQIDGDYDIYLVDDSEADYDEVPLPVPSQLTVVEQIIRTSPSGAQVVDLIIEVPDMPDGIEYGFRVVKL